MDWKAANEGWEAKTDKWQARVEQNPEQGWIYTIKPLKGEEPNVMGNSSSAELCQSQVAAMIDIMAKWG